MPIILGENKERSLFLQQFIFCWLVALMAEPRLIAGMKSHHPCQEPNIAKNMIERLIGCLLSPTVYNFFANRSRIIQARIKIPLEWVVIEGL